MGYVSWLEPAQAMGVNFFVNNIESKNMYMSTKIFKSVLMSLLPGLIFLCSCNSGETNGNGSPKTDTVLIEQMKFIPETISIHQGDTVLFINKDLVAHNATETNSAWHSPDLQMGDSWKFVPEKSAAYFCSIHLVMKGNIEVK